MNALKSCLLIAVCALCAGCKTTRSISNSGYEQDAGYGGYVSCDPRLTPPFAYRGELSEFDVLGVAPGQITSEREIGRALDNSRRIRLSGGSSMLLIQSGAPIPDGPMVTELSKYFNVIPFSGVPPVLPGTRVSNGLETMDSESYAKSLRLAAARGGNEMIVCYWGFLESEKSNFPTKTISWVPVVNWMLPDEYQHMRIRLKVALIDVRSGSWTVFSPKPFEDASWSISPRRGTADQKQVERLKQQAYISSAKELVKLYSNVAADQESASSLAAKAGSSSAHR
jgi:hypothetical protein